ncbi:MAG: UbiA family prenyltransferase [Synechococcus sp.]
MNVLELVDGGERGGRAPLPARLWRYQAERFPLLRHGPLILVFSGAAVGYASVQAGMPVRPAALPAATAVVLLQFLLMRIADEFKDADDDRRWRPQRPVPRGLVSLTELAGLGVLAAALQLAVVLAVSPAALPLLAAVWGWFLLMSAEFFRPRWLRRHLGLYALSHLLIVPLLALLAMAQLGAPPQLLAPLLSFLLCTYACAFCLELARKTRPPAAEQPGVDTYSARWGLRSALRIWLLNLLLSALAALAAAGLISMQGPLLLLAPLLLLSLGRVLPWLRGAASPSATVASGRDEPLEGLTALWILAVYGGLGWWPWLTAALQP